MLRAQALHQLVERITAHPRCMVAVDGIDASGKTHLADELAVLLPAVRASVDDFQHPRAYRHQHDYYEGAFDYVTLQGVLLNPFKQGQPFKVKAFDYRTDQPIEAPVQTASAETVLIVDGVFLHREALISAWDYRIWVQVDFEVALERAMRRDLILFGTADAIKKRYLERYFPAQKQYLEQVQPASKAHVIFINNDPENPELMMQ